MRCGAIQRALDRHCCVHLVSRWILQRGGGRGVIGRVRRVQRRRLQPREGSDLLHRVYRVRRRCVQRADQGDTVHIVCPGLVRVGIRRICVHVVCSRQL